MRRAPIFVKWTRRGEIAAQVAASAVLLSPFFWLYANELRLRAVERGLEEASRSLVERHASRAEAQASLARLVGERVYPSNPGGRAASLIADDPRTFGFVGSVAFARTEVFFDAKGRASSYRIERGGAAF